VQHPAISEVETWTVPVSDKTTWIFLALRFEDGSAGWGEATLSGAEEAVLAEAAHARSLLLGFRPAGPAAALAALRMAHASLARIVVMRAVEQALLDAMARRAGLPLAALLGGAERGAVPVYANINRGIADRSPAGFAARAKAVVESDGYRAVKIAPFDGLNWERSDDATGNALLAAGIARIAAVREAIGPERGLLVDCHSRLSPVMARTVLREAPGLFWLEEPLREDAFDAATTRALRGFANDRGIRLAGGEHIASLAEARDMLARGDYDAILPDLRWIGIRGAFAILELAAASGVAVSLHNPVGPVLDQVSLHVAAALPSFLILERQVRESPLFDALRGGAPVLSDGNAVPEGAAGFGAEPDRAVLGQHRGQAVRRAASLAGIGGAGADA